jgi:hypothetical protein
VAPALDICSGPRGLRSSTGFKFASERPSSGCCGEHLLLGDRRRHRVQETSHLSGKVEIPLRGKCDASDEAFFGVYEMLALQLSEQEDIALWQFLVEHAAETKRNDLLNRYTLARRGRAAAKRLDASEAENRPNRLAEREC